LATKKGGHIMYATCSINKNENEEIIKKLIKKKGDHVEVVPLQSPLGENTPWGVSVLPHQHQAGPAFFSLLRKL
jgi:16S rRNA C967 or C1407 C5-methylase (RsmB/RsmF family)